MGSAKLQLGCNETRHASCWSDSSLLAVLGGEIPEIHAHDDGTPGLYNEECPLARLAVRGWGLAAPAPDTLSQPDPIAVQASPSTPVRARSSGRLGVRAPRPARDLLTLVAH